MRFLVMWIALTVLNTWIVAHLDDAFGLRTAQLLKPGADLLSARSVRAADLMAYDTVVYGGALYSTASDNP